MTENILDAKTEKLYMCRSKQTVKHQVIKSIQYNRGVYLFYKKIL